MLITEENLIKIIREELSLFYDKESNAERLIIAEGVSNVFGTPGSIVPTLRAVDYGVEKWGDVGRKLHTTQIPLKNISVQKYLNDKARNSPAVKAVLAMSSGNQVKWLLKQFPRVSGVSIGNAIRLTNRDGHADISIQCKSWMPKIWIWPLLNEAANLLDIETVDGSEGGTYPKALEDLRKSITGKIERPFKEADRAWVSMRAKHSDTGSNVFSVTPIEHYGLGIARDYLSQLGSITAMIKHYRYQIKTIFRNDPMIIWLIMKVKSGTETIFNIEIGGETIEKYIIREAMAAAFPEALDLEIRKACNKLDRILKDPMNVPLPSSVSERVSKNHVGLTINEYMEKEDWVSEEHKNKIAQVLKQGLSSIA